MTLHVFTSFSPAAIDSRWEVNLPESQLEIRRSMLSEIIAHEKVIGDRP